MSGVWSDGGTASQLQSTNYRDYTLTDREIACYFSETQH